MSVHQATSKSFARAAKSKSAFKALETIGIERHSIVFRKANFRHRHVDAREQVVVERRFVRPVHPHCDRDIGTKSEIESDMPPQRSAGSFSASNNRYRRSELLIDRQKIGAGSFLT